MTEASHEEALRILGEAFEHRIARRLVQRRRLIREGETDIEGPLAFILPVSAEEVQLLAEVAERHYVPLVALGAGTAPDSDETSTEVGSRSSRGYSLAQANVANKLPSRAPLPGLERCCS